MRQPLHPSLVPTPAASRSTLLTRTGGAEEVPPKTCSLLQQLPPRALSRNRPESAAPAGTPDEAGAEPASASAAGLAINRHWGLTSAAATAASATRQPPQRTWGGGAGVRRGVCLSSPADVYLRNEMPRDATGSAPGTSSRPFLLQKQTKISGIVASLPHAPGRHPCSLCGASLQLRRRRWEKEKKGWGGGEQGRRLAGRSGRSGY